MHTINTINTNITPNSPAVHVSLVDEVIDGVEVFTDLYVYINHCFETGNVSVIGGEIDNDLYLGGETEGFLVEGNLEFAAERAIVEWFAHTLRGQEIVDETFCDACVSAEEARLERF